jgi:hypothetical protein
MEKALGLALCDARGPLTDLIQKLSGDNGVVWLKRLKMFLRGEVSILRIFANLTLTDRIARGRYDWVNSDITKKHFPTSVPADYDVEYKLFHFNHTISSDDAIKETEKEGFRPGILVELLALGETNPELQKQFPIVALGSAWRRPLGGRCVPCLCWDGSELKLRLEWFEGVWDDYVRFLAVRK